MKENLTPIDFGEVGWKVKKPDGTFYPYTFSSIRAAEEHFREDDDVSPVRVDTSPTVREVLKQIECEKEIWEEYFTPEFKTNSEKWPDEYGRLHVFVVTGGSEGMYLHVEAYYHNDHPQILILGKTLRYRTHAAELWDSARRIATRLGA